MNELPKKIDPQFSADAWRKLKDSKDWKSQKPALQNDKGLEGCLRDLDTTLRNFARDCTADNAEEVRLCAWTTQAKLKDVPEPGKAVAKFLGDLRAYTTDMKLRAMIHIQEINKMAQREQDAIKTTHARLLEGIRARNAGIDELKDFRTRLEDLLARIEKNDTGSAAAVTAAQNTIREYEARAAEHERTLRKDFAKGDEIRALNSPLLDALLPKYQIFLSKYIPQNLQIKLLVAKIRDAITQRSLANAGENELIQGIRAACSPLEYFVGSIDSNTTLESVTERLKSPGTITDPGAMLKMEGGRFKTFVATRDQAASKLKLATNLIKQGKNQVATKPGKEALKGFASTVAATQKKLAAVDDKIKKVTALFVSFKKQYKL